MYTPPRQKLEQMYAFNTVNLFVVSGVAAMYLSAVVNYHTLRK